jgi:hypothetical protein
MKVNHMAIKKGYKANFYMLLKAAKANDLALLECQDKATGKIVNVICALNRMNDGIEFAPLAKLFDGNPYDELNPPNPDGGFHIN